MFSTVPSCQLKTAQTISSSSKRFIRLRGYCKPQSSIVNRLRLWWEVDTDTAMSFSEL